MQSRNSPTNRSQVPSGERKRPFVVMKGMQKWAFIAFQEQVGVDCGLYTGGEPSFFLFSDKMRR